MAKGWPAGWAEACQADCRLSLDLAGIGDFGRVGREAKRPSRNTECFWEGSLDVGGTEDGGEVGNWTQKAGVWGRPQGRLLQTQAAVCHHLCHLRSDVPRVVLSGEW